MEYIMINMLQSKWNEILSTLKREHEISDVSFNLYTSSRRKSGT